MLKHLICASVSLCIEGVDLNSTSAHRAGLSPRLPLHRGSGFKLLYVSSVAGRFQVSLCIEGVDLNFPYFWIMFFFFVSLCIEGVDLNLYIRGPILRQFCLPLHRGSGFKLLVFLHDFLVDVVSLCIEGVDLN